jgi:outer membrane protein assembly factor BamB
MNSCLKRIGIYAGLALIFSGGVVVADDWPMWRKNAGRTAASAEQLPENLTLLWSRQLPLTMPAYRSTRLQFDAGYEPIVAKGHLLIASSLHDSVSAYDAVTGLELWVYQTDGPVRFAPAVAGKSVCFGSDDGYFYCVDLATGRLRWKHQVVPSDRRLLGNRRLISVWPVRGGPVVADGRVYFAAGVWPFEGVFICALDTATGALIWRNERLGYLFGQQPHDTKAIGGLAPQGYLIVDGEELIVPCSTAYPARLNRETGQLIEFELPAPGGLPGGWYASLDAETSRAIRRGKLTFDDVINSQLHEDKVRHGKGSPGVSRMIHVAGRTLKFDDRLDGVSGMIHSMVVANGHLYVSTRAGELFCFGARDERKAKHWRAEAAKLSADPNSMKLAASLIGESTGPHGHAVVLGLNDGALTKALLLKSRYHVIAVDDDPARVRRLRRELQGAGLYGNRCSVIQSAPASFSLPPYLATLITTETPDRIENAWAELSQALRPYGGIAAPRTRTRKPAGFELSELNGMAIIRRAGALPGSAQYKGNYAHCEDTLVRFPLGVLWFDDTLSHFKRSPQPEFGDGIMVSRPKDWQAERVKGDWSIDYPLRRPVLSDMYTGRILQQTEQTSLRSELPDIGRSSPQPSYYHAPHQKTWLQPEPPVVGTRTNPLTGQEEPRVFPKTYGCDGGVDYGSLYTLRSGTAAFYDKSLESGTVFISGPRSGCSNSIIPSGGLLNVPYFYEGCTCSYPLPIGLAMVAMPQTYEQWASWGDDPVKSNSVRRIGLNFGAPGDRKTRDGTLWLDYPSVGGPSPRIRVETSPANPTFHYRHSLWMNEGESWPWIGASAVEGLRELKLHDLKPGRYAVRLHFAETGSAKVGERRQSVWLQGKPVLRNLDILTTTKRPMTGMVHEVETDVIDGTLKLTLEATTGRSLISGIELIRNP